jgi:CheY-like chemotaxis protein
MGCGVSKVAEHKSYFISRHILKTADADPALAATFKMLLFDSNSRNAFYRFIELNYSEVNIEFYEGVDALIQQVKDGVLSDSACYAKVTPFLQMAYLNDLCVHPELKQTLKQLLLTKIQPKIALTKFEMEFLLKDLAAAQLDIISSMGQILQSFERSKEFADYIIYSSMPSEKKIQTQSRKRNKSNHSISRSFFNGLKSKEILIVENSTLVAKILICSLQSTFSKVFHAVNEKEALAALSERPFDVILFSLDITDRGGLDVIITKYKERCIEFHIKPDKFVGMIGDANSGLVQDALDRGFRAVLVKPFSYEQVVAALKH